ncbi:thioesterase II family protein [Ktedonobacter robiniae]|nr:thioesterase [Ktedonobacter robiniae]
MFTSPDGWIHYPRPNKRATTRLFCFPGMGAYTSLYAHWPDFLPASMEVCIMQLPGRLPEPDIPTDAAFSMVIEAMAEAISQHQDLPFAFFGHCLGATLAYEVAQQLRRYNHHGPDQLFFACFSPPHMLYETLPFLQTASISSDIFFHVNYVKGQRNAPDLFELDAMLWQQYRYCPGEPFACPLTIFGAELDPYVSADQLAAWKTYTTGRFALQMFPGHHCFFYIDAQPLLDAIAGRFQPSLNGVEREPVRN